MFLSVQVQFNREYGGLCQKSRKGLGCDCNDEPGNMPTSCWKPASKQKAADHRRDYRLEHNLPAPQGLFTIGKGAAGDRERLEIVKERHRERTVHP